MRHQKAGRKFGRNTSHRRAMFRNMAGNLVLHEQIKTTDAKAKELRRIAERLVTKALRLGDDLTVDVAKVKDEGERQRILARRLHARRQVARFLPRQLAKTNPDGTVEEVDLIHKLFNDIAPRYVERAKNDKGGGYTRIIKVNHRRGDNAPMSLIEFLS
ncbi:MAG: 50S ribosomal protein L17 [Myxococcales bacterium]|nr:50S ribosomal protein L17 [Myxococcales bacterium]MDH3482762.1 50S ribosomal protein L17 [Myxococcales bacterium]